VKKVRQTDMNSDPSSADEPLPETASCPRCATLLLVRGIQDGRVVLCSACRLSFVLRPEVDKRKNNRKAVWSLALGFCTILFACLAGLPAIVLGVLALYEISRKRKQLKGELLAVAGIVMGIVCNFLCTPIAWALLIPAIQALRAAISP